MMKQALFFLLAAIEACCCTGIKLKAKDGSVVHGRTAEFGIELDLSLLYIPRGYRFQTTTPLGSGLSYQTKYAALGVIAFGVPAIMDGMNEKGLSIGIFYFPNYASYTPTTPANLSKSLSPLDFANWILTQFASIDEIKDAIEGVCIAPTVFPQWGSEPPPFHYIIFERSGRSIVIEPIEGALVVRENPLGIITNSPTFDWHMTNLKNYVNLSPFNAKPLRFDGVDFIPFGQGSGMVGLPGDFSPPSRFVRASVFSITAIPSPSAAKAILQGFHILNNFDIPIGTVRAAEGKVVHTDRTLATCMRDPQGLKYYVKTYDNQTIKMVDLNSFDFSSTALKNLSLSGSQPIDNASGNFQKMDDTARN